MTTTLFKSLGSSPNAKAFVPAYGVNSGTLVQFDLWNPDCMAADATDFETAINLADARMKALTGASQSLIMNARGGFTSTYWDITAGKGIKQVSQNTNSGMNIALASNSEARPAEFDAYCYAGGVDANQPDLVFSMWFRWLLPEPRATNFDLCYFAEFDETPAIWHIDRLDGLLILHGQASGIIAPSSPCHIAISKDAMFLNGKKVQVLSTTPYHATLDMLSPGNAVHWRFFPTGITDVETWILYSVRLEDLKVSGRTSGEVAAAEYRRGLRYAPFITTP